MTNYTIGIRCSFASTLSKEEAIRLDELHQSFVEGDRSALMLAVLLCAESKLVMPEWVSKELEGMDDKLNADFELTLDKYFGSDRENKQTFNKDYQAQANEEKIVMILANHCIGGGVLDTDGLQEIARESDFTRGEVKVIYDKHKKLLRELNANSSVFHGKGELSNVLFYMTSKNK